MRRAALAAALVLVAACGGGGDAAEPAAGPAPSVPHVGRFVAECDYSHTAPDDPIVRPGEPGASHLHDFFGATTTDAHSDAASLLAGGTTCEVTQDHAAYWVPALLDGGVPVRPLRAEAYYRAAPGVEPTDVVPYPEGLMVLAGSPAGDGPQPTEIVGWACGNNPARNTEAPACGARSPLVLRLTFPDCWDGTNLDAPDHRAHMTYSGAAGCPSRHPVAVPQLELVVRYPVSGDVSGLELSSGPLTTAHGDFLNAWDPDKLEREVRLCIHADVVCGIAPT